MREMVAFFMRSPYHAIVFGALFGALSYLFLPLAYVSGAIVALVVLRQGAWRGSLVGVAVAVIAVLALPFFKSRPGFPVPPLFFLLPPVGIAAWVLRNTQSQGAMLLTIGVFVAATVAGMYLFIDDVVGWWRAWLQVAVGGVPGATVQGFEKEGTLQLMNGLMAMLFGVTAILIVFIARWWQSLVYNPGAFAPEFNALRLTPWLALPATALAVSMMTGISRSGLPLDLLMVATIMYLFQGLAVVHGITAARKQSLAWLIPLYGGLIIAPQFLVVGLAFLGLVDSLYDFRRRSAPKPPKPKT